MPLWIIVNSRHRDRRCLWLEILQGFVLKNWLLSYHNCRYNYTYILIFGQQPLFEYKLPKGDSIRQDIRYWHLLNFRSYIYSIHPEMWSFFLFLRLPAKSRSGGVCLFLKRLQRRIWDIVCNAAYHWQTTSFCSDFIHEWITLFFFQKLSAPGIIQEI